MGIPANKRTIALRMVGRLWLFVCPVSSTRRGSPCRALAALVPTMNASCARRTVRSCTISNSAAPRAPLVILLLPWLFASCDIPPTSLPLSKTRPACALSKLKISPPSGSLLSPLPPPTRSHNNDHRTLNLHIQPGCFSTLADILRLQRTTTARCVRCDTRHQGRKERGHYLCHHECWLGELAMKMIHGADRGTQVFEVCKGIYCQRSSRR